MPKCVEGKSDLGITVGLIDAIISVARVAHLRLDYDTLLNGERGDEFQPIRDALRDLKSCEEFQKLIGYDDANAMEIIHSAADLLRQKTT